MHWETNHLDMTGIDTAQSDHIHVLKKKIQD